MKKMMYVKLKNKRITIFLHDKNFFVNTRTLVSFEKREISEKKLCYSP